MQTCILGIHLYTAGLDDDPSLIAESILGIDDQIQDDLPNLGFVSFYVGAFGIELQLNRDVFADGTLQNAMKSAYDLIEIDNLWLIVDVAATEIKQLSGQVFGPMRRGYNSGQFWNQRVTGRHLGHHHLGIPHDRRQQVVEVVGDTAGQVADGIHLLRLTQLRLQLIACFLGLLSGGRIAEDPRASLLHPVRRSCRRSH